MTSRANDIIFLLGAGASAETGIPTSADMIRHIEDLLRTDNKWKKHADLYNHVKSAIYYAAGLRGHFNDQVNYNIETLVNSTSSKGTKSTRYFIASWNSRFVALAKPDFSGVGEFRRLILAALKKWMCPEGKRNAGALIRASRRAGSCFALCPIGRRTQLLKPR